MFFYVTNTKFLHNVEYQRLDSVDEPLHTRYVDQIVEWLEGKWGYLRNLGAEWRRRDVLLDENKYFIVTYLHQPIGLFVLKDFELWISHMRIKELWCFYIDESFRGHGLAPRMMELVKNACQIQAAEMIVLDTFNPMLNKFYEKHGAKVVCDGAFVVAVENTVDANGETYKISYPTTLLRMNIST